MSATATRELRRVEAVMGTTVSIDIQPPLVADEVLDEVVERLHDATRGSARTAPTARSAGWRDGELLEENASADLRHVLAACDHLAVMTGGAFDARHHRSDGRFDPSGYVKGWAIEEAAWLIDSAGGAQLLDQRRRRHRRPRAGRAPGRPWRVGIRHPDQADQVAAVLAVSDRAVATSGSYERGDHIADPRTGDGARRAAERDGRRAAPRLHRRLRDRALRDGPRRSRLALDPARPADYAAYAITDDDRVVWTEGMERYLVREDLAREV